MIFFLNSLHCVLIGIFDSVKSHDTDNIVNKHYQQKLIATNILKKRTKKHFRVDFKSTHFFVVAFDMNISTTEVRFSKSNVKACCFLIYTSSRVLRRLSSSSSSILRSLSLKTNTNLFSSTIVLNVTFCLHKHTERVIEMFSNCAR